MDEYQILQLRLSIIFTSIDSGRGLIEDRVVSVGQ